MNLDFEIAVDQQTKAHNRTSEVVSDSGCPTVQNLAANFLKAEFMCQMEL